MTKSYAVTATGLLILVLTGCTQAPPPPPAVDLAAEEAKIKELEAAWNKDWAMKDAEKIVANYASDATLMAPGMAAMKGTAAIRPGLKPLLDDPKLSLVFAAQHVEVSKDGDMAASQGTYTMTMTDPKTKKPMTEKGNYVTVYKKQADGSWKAVQDINTPDGTK